MSAEPPAPGRGPLAGYRALDLSDVEGQMCGRLLADLGLEVLKVEPPGGDPLRSLGAAAEGAAAAGGSEGGPPGAARPDAAPCPPGVAPGPLFRHLNAGKRSIVLDPTHPEGRRRLEELLGAVDVVIDSGSPTALRRMGADRRRLLASHPRLVYAAVTGWGLDGPRADRPYSDLTVQAASGWLSLSGEPGEAPCRPPEPQAFHFGGIFAALGVVAALYARGRDGGGDWIDVSMQECLAVQEHIVRLASLERRAVVRGGSQHASVSPATLYPCRDGHVFLYITVKHWRTFLKVWAGHPAELDGPEWDANDYRRARAGDLNARVGAWTRTMSRDELVGLLQDAGIPCLPVNTPAEFAADAQTVARHFIQEVHDPVVRDPVVHDPVVHDPLVHDAGRGAGARDAGAPPPSVLRQPAAPFLIDGTRPAARAAPAAGEAGDGDRGGAGEAGWESPGPQRRAPALLAPALRAPALRAPALRAPEPPPTAPGAPADAAAPDEARPLPLAGLRVLGFDQVLAGPFATQLLCLLGAEVVKVESRSGGLDQFRFFGDRSDLDSSPRFLEFNRSKRSVTINLKREGGRELILRLARRCDVVLDNFSAHVMPSLGLAYEDLRRAHPGIVVLRMPGLGCSGPKRQFASVGNTITAFTGLTHLWGHPGRAGAPVGSQVVYPDYVSGVLAATACVAAVCRRLRTGEGASIDLSQAEAAAYMIGATLIRALRPGEAVGPAGNRSELAAPEGCYPCRGEDSWCAVSVCGDGQWRALAAAVGLAALQDPDLATAASRRRRADELDRALAAWTRQRDASEVEAALSEAGVPCSAVRTGLDVVGDAHLHARSYLVPVDLPRFGRFLLPRLPLVFGRHRSRTDWEFPALGRHSRDVLAAWLGMGDDEIARLAAEGVVG